MSGNGWRWAEEAPEPDEIAPDGPESGQIVPDEGISATHLTPEQVQGLVERTGAQGSADDIARRSR